MRGIRVYEAKCGDTYFKTIRIEMDLKGEK